MQAWPHQTFAFEAVLAAEARGVGRLVLTSPTGGGKSRIMQNLAQHWLQHDFRAILLTNRKLLIDQTLDRLTEAGINHGIRAAGHEPDPRAKFQVSSIQTEHSRVVKRKSWELFPADLVLVDEGHLYANPQGRSILDQYHARGALIVLFTATPFGLGDMADELIVAGTNSELRECGALVPARHYGPDEPDLKDFKAKRDGYGLTEKEAGKAMMRPGIFGRVWDSFEALNPEHKPTILFAPGVAESVWFCEEFNKKGVAAAHIDGEDVWLDGELRRSSFDLREEVLERSKDETIRVLCNRFVLREGIDAPWLCHGILATVFGSLQSYLQSGGRLLRSCPGLQAVTIQDHGGNWHRFGSLNEDRAWSLNDTDAKHYHQRADRLRANPDEQPRRCPKCSRIIIGRSCPCGYQFGQKVSRPVVGTDGTLKELHGLPFKARRLYTHHNAAALWERMYYRAKSEKWDATFLQAEARFAAENNWGWPSRQLPFMPADPDDFYRKVSELRPDQLIPKEPRQESA